MAKPDKPLLSLGARGTIGDALTYQRRGREHIVRQKPIPRDPYSLAQAYQRWDYRDYAYLWTLLTNSQKQAYRTAASRYHITGFSLWMREQLRTLPDIALRWHLDERSGATAYDSSKNTNHGVITGPTPVDGVIDGAYSFDGINDRIVTPDHPSLQLPTTFTIESFFQASPPANICIPVHKGVLGGAPFNYSWRLFPTGILDFRVWPSAGGPEWVRSFGVVADGLKHHLASTFNIVQMENFVDGVSVGVTPTGGTADIALTHPLRLGYWWVVWFPGILDELVIENRVLDLTTIKRHSERRYPA